MGRIAECCMERRARPVVFCAILLLQVRAHVLILIMCTLTRDSPITPLAASVEGKFPPSSPSGIEVLNIFSVYPGDTLTNTYSMNIFTKEWHVNWVVIPGPNGQATGSIPFSGGLVFNPQDHDDDGKFASGLVQAQ